MLCVLNILRPGHPARVHRHTRQEEHGEQKQQQRHQRAPRRERLIRRASLRQPCSCRRMCARVARCARRARVRLICQRPQREHPAIRTRGNAVRRMNGACPAGVPARAHHPIVETQPQPTGVGLELVRVRCAVELRRTIPATARDGGPGRAWRKTDASNEGCNYKGSRCE